MGAEDRGPSRVTVGAADGALVPRSVLEGSQVSDHGVGPGSVVAGRFRLEDLLEEAGGARFWRATDLTLARDVGVHVLPIDDPRAPAALTAARTSALVSDSHILRVLDAVEQGDVAFLVHEWGSGVSLDQMLADDVLDGHRAAWLVREVAHGIVAGHTMGVAHGRLLPENVLITDAGSVKLIGFVVNGVLHGRPDTLPDGGEPPSEHESDVLNLGALLYACLVGRWPGFPDSVVPPAPRENGRPLRPRRVKAGVPKFLDTLCQDVLGAGRDGRETGRARYESAAAVAEALSRYLGDGGGALPVVNAFTELGGPTAFVDPTRAPGPSTPGTLGSFDGDTGEQGADLEATQAVGALDDSAPGRAVRRDQISDSSADASAQVDTEERDFDQPAPWSATQVADERVERSRAAREALGRRSDEAAEAFGAPPGDAAREQVPRLPPHGSSQPHAGGSGAWGPPVRPVGAPGRTGRGDKPGALAMRLAALVAVVVLIVVGVLMAFNLGGSRTPSGSTPEEDESTPTRTFARVEVAQVLDLDPPSRGGNGEENAELTGLTRDGDPATSWRTETYFDGPALAPYKQGVGLVVDLGEERQVREVVLRLKGQGYDVTLFATAPGTAAPPSDIDGLQQEGRERGTVDDVRFETDVTTQYLVVWFRSLPQTSGGYSGEVAEIVVRS